MLVPLILVGWDRVLQGQGRHAPALLGCMALLAWSVPMMLLDLLPFLGLDFLVRAVRRELSRWAWLVLLGALVFVLGGVAWLSLRAGLDELVYTACVVAGIARPEGPPAIALEQVFLSYITPKRLLPGGWIAPLGAFAVGAVLVLLLIRA